MSGFDWLLVEPDIAVPASPRFLADDDNWRASIERIAVSRSLEVYLNDIQVHRDLHVKPMEPRLTPRLVSQVAIQGGLDLIGDDGVRVRPSRETAVMLGGRPRPATHSFKAGTRLQFAAYVLDVERIEQLFDGSVPPVLRRLVEESADSDLFIETPSNTILRGTARRLFSPHLNGPLRRVALEGLTLHLFAQQMAAVLAHQPDRQSTEPPPRERAAIIEARERLLADMRDPPTLSELAQAVGLREKRLNAGFRSMFGATVFETLRNERLEQARRALETEPACLKQVAFRVGYNHISNFVSAFHRRFGAPPGRYVELAGAARKTTLAPRRGAKRRGR